MRRTSIMMPVAGVTAAVVMAADHLWPALVSSRLHLLSIVAALAMCCALRILPHWILRRFVLFTSRWSNQATTTQSTKQLPSMAPDEELRQANLPRPRSVNYHFLRRCNYRCDFCFHTFKGGREVLPDLENEVFPVLRELRRYGMEKINFSGGEPFLHPQRLEKMVRFCKVELDIAVSIVTNASLVKRDWLVRNRDYIDYIALSCDAFDEDTCVEIGRTDDRQTGDHVGKVRNTAMLLHQLGIRVRINTVVCKANVERNFAPFIKAIGPVARWKVFQLLLVDGENTGAGQQNGRSASHLVISDAEFAAFVERHRRVECMVVEGNADMANSYLILDEQLRFLDTSKGSKIPSQPVPEVGVVAALRASNGYDEEAFVRRQGIYEYSRGSANAGRQTGDGCDIEDLVTLPCA